MHGCLTMLAAAWETAVASLAFAMLMASLAYCAGKLWQHDRELVGLRGKHDKDIVALHARIVAIEQNCERHQGWATDMQKAIQRIDRSVAKIGGKLDLDVEPADDP